MSVNVTNNFFDMLKKCIIHRLYRSNYVNFSKTSVEKQQEATDEIGHQKLFSNTR